MALTKVFCLEPTIWWDDEGLPGRTTVLPTLEMLERMELLNFIHRPVLGRPDFDEYLRMRRRRNRSYKLIYLAFHGTEKGLTVGDDDVSLEELAELIGRAPDAVIHLGSCSVLRGNKPAARRFLEATEARVISGYRQDIDWVECAAFDQIFISYLAYYEKVGTALRFMKERHDGLRRLLKWDFIDSKQL